MLERRLMVIVSLALAVSLTASCGGEDKGGLPDVPGGAQVPELAQAVPVWNLFKACRDNDLDLFKSIWTKERTAELEAEGWEKSLEFWRGEIAGAVESGFTLADFTFDYRDGRVHLTFKGEGFSGLDVEEEDGVWRMSER
jgi:hypothetical protein